MSFPFKPVLLAAIVSQTFPAFAADPVPQAYQDLNEVKVIGGRKVQKLGVEKVRRQALDKQMVSDESDLVRYDPGISVVEGGRSGSNGFTIRGVDKDRVAINVDGLAQAESRSSEAFQELFGAHGNFNANRNTSEPENFSEVTITKGADSLKSGSGALGGAVNYKTKSASDYVSEEKPYHLGIKGGYIGRNSQKFSSITAAGTWLGLDALMVYTRRFGKETKNNSDAADTVITDNKQSWNPNAGITNYGSRGVARSKPDPQDWENKSTLFKLGYNFNDQNRIGWIYEDSRTDRTTTELSNMWAANWKGEALGDTRSRQDISYRKRIGFEYKNQLDKGPWDSLNLRYDRQTIDMSTWTWDLPTDYAKNGINSDVYHMFRNIRQKISNLVPMPKNKSTSPNWYGLCNTDWAVLKTTTVIATIAIGYAYMTRNTKRPTAKNWQCWSKARPKTVLPTGTTPSNSATAANTASMPGFATTAAAAKPRTTPTIPLPSAVKSPILAASVNTAASATA